ncbi:aminoglycoside phosphotransferase family protein [Acuticoccus sediminis]|uniref:aminoglycoside phosphotransferase family protein n=1 Tax=Acuticoccus sediminis TaxID=2184697 RepID=UPI001CFE61C8|nr:aminoglycoside phosphotransferase family protein [Acuticoccus sediminis]
MQAALDDEPRAARTVPGPASAAEIAEARAAAVSVRPDLRRATAEVQAAGWDCLGLRLGDAMFKLPRTEAAAWRLCGEPARLALARRHLATPRIPDMTVHRAPRLFSEHPYLEGSLVDPATYHAMPETARDRLADEVAAVYVALHRIPVAEVEEAGIGRVAAWPSAERLFDAAARVLDPPLLASVGATLGRVSVSLPDTMVFGHFDTHGWNMACDTATGRLDGLFDFGDAGLGPRHTDLSYPSFVSPDLTLRVLRRYEARGGRPVDVDHVMDLHTVLRVVEVVEAGERPAPFVWALTDWLAALDRSRSEGEFGAG